MRPVGMNLKIYLLRIVGMTVAVSVPLIMLAFFVNEVYDFCE